MTYTMQFFPFIIAIAVFWYAYTYPVRKAKRLLPTLPQYLQSHPECKTDTGIKCRVCGSKSIKNWGIRTLMEMWHGKQSFDSLEHRQKELCRFVNFYNTVKPHRSLNGDTPFEVLQAYFSQPVV